MQNKINSTLKALTAAVLIAGATAADAEWSANVALTTDYVWRGVSQTNEDPALQGGFDYATKEGLYFGVWGSNVDFGSVENLEIDLYGGWSGDVGGTGLDIGIIKYNYFATDNDIDFAELYIGASWKMFSVKYSAQIQGDDIGDYLEAALSFDLAQGAALALHVGRYDLDSGEDYTDYSIGVSKEIGGFGFDLTFYDTDSDGEKIFGDNAEGRLVFTVSKSM